MTNAEREFFEPRLPMELSPERVKKIGTISLVMCDLHDRAATRAQELASILPETQFYMSDIIRTKDKTWSHDFKNCVGLFAINAKGEMVACHLPPWEASERRAINSGVLHIVEKKWSQGETVITKHRKDGRSWQEVSGNPHELESGKSQIIAKGSQFEHLVPDHQNFERVTIEFKSGRKLLMDSADADRNYLRQRGMWDEEDEVWLQNEFAKLGTEEFIKDRKLAEYFAGTSARISLRALSRQVLKLGRDTEFYIIGGNAFDDNGWTHYLDAVAMLDKIAMQAVGNHAVILTPPSMRTEKNYDSSKSYLFDPEERRVYSFGFSTIAKASGPDVLPFGVRAEWAPEIYGPYFEKFKLLEDSIRK